MADIDLDSYIGKPTAASTITVERGPVSAFATSVLDSNPVFHDAEAAREAGFDGVAVPPTWCFSAAEAFGRFRELQPPDPSDGQSPTNVVMGTLMSEGGLILHGEQAFEYERPVVVGETLHHKGIVKDIYQKPTGDRTMTFMVIENTFTDDAGDLVLTHTTNLLHRS